MPDEFSLYELRRLIERNHLEVREDYQQIRERLDQFVLREVYSADEARRTLRFEQIEAELKRASQMRVVMATLAVTAFIGPIITGIIVFVVSQSLK